MKPVVINLSTPQYHKGQERLKGSVRYFSENIPVLTWKSETDIKAPLHRVNPYAFKVYAFYQAINQGYDTIFWMDASCYLIKDITPLFELIDREGYFMEEAGHWVGKWTNDNARAYFGIDREILDNTPTFTAGCFGLSVFSQTAMAFLDDWRKSMEAGAFKGSWSDHRHDLTCGSIIAKTLGMEYKRGGTYMCYGSPDTVCNDTVVIKLQGII